MSEGQIIMTFSPRMMGKSWMVQQLLALLALEQARGIAHDLIWVDELPKEITLDSWADLGTPERHQDALQRVAARMEASAVLPKATTGLEGRSQEYARRAQEASRRHGNLAVLKAKAHRR